MHSKAILLQQEQSQCRLRALQNSALEFLSGLVDDF